MENEKTTTFDTSSHYAIVAGWLILPAVSVVVTLLVYINTITSLDFTNYVDQGWYYILTYVITVLFIPFSLFILYMWWKRKRLLPKLMIAYFIINLIWSLVYMLYEGYIGLEWYNVVLYSIGIAYFVKSKRVELTFVR